MDLPHPHFARTERPDAVRQWAELEGKSDTMSDDLCRQFAEATSQHDPPQPKPLFIAEMFVAIVNAWWQFRSR